jgi:hypothetical protein
MRRYQAGKDDCRPRALFQHGAHIDSLPVEPDMLKESDIMGIIDEPVSKNNLDLSARPFAEQHAITSFDIDRNELAGLIAATRAHSYDLALGRLFLSGIRDDDATGGFLLGIDALDNDAVVKRTKLHGVLLHCQTSLFFDELPTGAKILPCEALSF